MQKIKWAERLNQCSSIFMALGLCNSGQLLESREFQEKTDISGSYIIRKGGQYKKNRCKERREEEKYLASNVNYSVFVQVNFGGFT